MMVAASPFNAQKPTAILNSTSSTVLRRMHAPCEGMGVGPISMLLASTVTTHLQDPVIHGAH